ncbi:hypothetical protein [Anaeromyxobacter terrae]|uniref:hypothetical protein n=1 Tax=Anaeromyxobacter terrae TaxID=2925406 RepID=UPI001F5A64DD|nr:hypothetical protein [Anaeromyxobacter sp. SG22]
MRAASERGTLEKRLDAGGWGLFFIWVGVALALDVGWGAGLVGVGVITLGVQVVRKLLGLDLDRFSLAVGALFVAGGIWKLVDVTVALVPLLCIAAGFALLASALSGSPRASRRRVGPGAPAAHRPA